MSRPTRQSETLSFKEHLLGSGEQLCFNGFYLPKVKAVLRRAQTVRSALPKSTPLITISKKLYPGTYLILINVLRMSYLMTNRMSFRSVIQCFSSVIQYK